MKIIALLPIKNESWILPTFLSSIKKIVDEIIVIDDNSTDNSRELVKSYGGVVYENEKSRTYYFSEFEVRKRLIEIGRKHGGTHFIFLDADEVLTSNFQDKCKNLIEKMTPGQKIYLPWISLWKSNEFYRDDSGGMFNNPPKDVIYCDDGHSGYSYAFIGVSRCPDSPKNITHINIPIEEGGILHFQFTDWKSNEIKQAWYRCSELINGKRSARRINYTYSYLLDDKKAKIFPVLQTWIKGINLPKIDPNRSSWHLNEILKLFNQYDIEFFEPLQIWHIKELKDEFIKRVGRNPISKTFPKFITKLNDIRNRLRYLIKK